MEKINLKTPTPLPKKADVTEVKKYEGPFPVIKPTKKLTEEDLKIEKIK